jgi:ribosomal protein S18
MNIMDAKRTDLLNGFIETARILSSGMNGCPERSQLELAERRYLLA